MQRAVTSKERTITPLVRVDLIQGKPAGYRKEIGAVIFEAMIEFGVLVLSTAGAPFEAQMPWMWSSGWLATAHPAWRT